MTKAIINYKLRLLGDLNDITQNINNSYIQYIETINQYDMHYFYVNGYLSPNIKKFQFEFDLSDLNYVKFIEPLHGSLSICKYILNASLLKFTFENKRLRIVVDTSLWEFRLRKNSNFQLKLYINSQTNNVSAAEFDPSQYENFFDIEDGGTFLTPLCDDCDCPSNISREFIMTPKVLLIKERTDKSLYLEYYSSILGLTDEAVAGSLYIEPTKLEDPKCANGLDNFWRSVVNMQFANESRLSVSQACPIRNCTFGDIILCTGLVDGKFNCCDGNAEFTSGGFMSDCVINGTMDYCSQQQFCTQNTEFKSTVQGGAWSLVFYNCTNAPDNQDYKSDPAQPAITNLNNSDVTIPENQFKTPPILIYEDSSYKLKVGEDKSSDYLKYSATPKGDSPVVLDKGFFENVNGEYIILPAGIYELREAVTVSSNLIGIGLPIIRFYKDAKMDFTKENGCCSSIIFDNFASEENASRSIDYFLKVSAKNVSLFDIFMRNGGPVYNAIIKKAMLIVSNENVYLNNIWLWNADHNIDGNPPTDPVDLKNYNYQCPTGLIVEENAKSVVAICLASEHMLEDNVSWKGNNGICVFFQNEFPYYVNPENNTFTKSALDCSSSDSFKGYALGSYCYFRDQPVKALQAFHINANSFIIKAFTKWLNGNDGSKIQNILMVNEKGDGKQVTEKSQGPLFTSYT